MNQTRVNVCMPAVTEPDMLSANRNRVDWCRQQCWHYDKALAKPAHACAAFVDVWSKAQMG